MQTKTSGNTEPSDKKLEELILYIAMLSEGDNAFGAVKLNKLLFFADFTAYLRFGKSITGQEYQKLKYGPAPRRLVPLRAKLESNGDIGVRPQETHAGFPQDKVFALRVANIDAFTPTEIDLVNRLVQAWWGRSATEISNMSHQFVGWQAASEGETIPYEVALVDYRDRTDEESEHCKDLEDLAAKYHLDGHSAR